MRRLDKLKKAIEKRERLLVLFSGGLDSSLLARLAYDVLGTRAAALTFDSPIIPRHEIAQAKKDARRTGIEHVIIPIDEIEQIPHFAENPPERCYLCRKKRNELARVWANEHGFSTIADGMNFSDFDDYRPGMKASIEDQVWQPFVDLRITKDDIRQYSKELGIAAWDKPNTVCLCSRFPYGSNLTKEDLWRVEAAEAYLRKLGFIGFRLRSFPYDMAVIELAEPEKALEYRAEITAALTDLGFLFVTLDLEGFLSGKMNRIIAKRPA
ncbi:MAG TPA: ATP-dependent sacrificial sulfur transferase LarE [Deltaproteobacteria bacterium]|nr:ATP-dependent sacrificial sulfur transferase LarE [Deltaproteobacteria bacterium]